MGLPASSGEVHKGQGKVPVFGDETARTLQASRAASCLIAVSPYPEVPVYLALGLTMAVMAMAVSYMLSETAAG